MRVSKSSLFQISWRPQHRYSRSPPIRQAQGMPIRQAQGMPIRQAQGMPIRQAQGMLPRGQASREGEVCSFLRHSVRLVAEGVAGPARICNAGAGCWDTRMAPRGRGGQGDGAGSLSRIFTATVRPRGTPLRNGTHKGRPYGCLGPNPAWGQGFRAAGSIARAGLKPARYRVRG